MRVTSLVFVLGPLFAAPADACDECRPQKPCRPHAALDKEGLARLRPLPGVREARVGDRVRPVDAGEPVGEAVDQLDRDLQETNGSQGNNTAFAFA